MSRFNHMPAGYVCPFCLVVNGVEDEENKRVHSKQQDIVLQDDQATALIASLWWPNNKGNVVIVPNRHFENIFDLPISYATSIHRLAQRVAFAMKDCYGCEGVSTRQHNEPSGGQDVWHYHLHVYPRYKGDNFYATHGTLSTPQDRLVYAERLRAWFRTHE